MKPASSRKPFYTGSVVGVGLGRFAFAATAFAVAVCPPALAGPKGEKVVHGQASFLRHGAVTTIQAGHNAIINYNSFNIGAHETVRFIQPSASSRVLNRVLSHDPTIIDGKLLSNGMVYIANPAGIYFGGEAIVSVGGIVAAAGTITNEDFLGGVDRFTDVSGSVANLGTIQGSSVDLVGHYVANHGVIYADRGTVTLSAGDEVFIGPRGGGVYVKIKSEQAPSTSGAAGVENTGSIEARGGASLLTAGDFYSLAVRNTGSVRAAKIKVEGTGAGQVAVGGTLDASSAEPGGTGGTVHVLGERVGLYDATIDASGDAGGGEVLIGGDYQGRGEVRNAERTYVSAGTEVRADAGTEGDGGKVVVWSNEFTRFQGEISARGGDQGGDGGFAEVSGKNNLEYAGRADLRAAHGQFGTLLLDPNNISIELVPPPGAANNTNISGTGTTGDPFTTSDDGAVLDTFALVEALGLGNVVVQTGTAGTNAEDGDITVTDDIVAPASGGSLTLLAHDDIFLNADIDFDTNSVASDVLLRADGVSPDGDGAIVNGGGSIRMGGGSLLLTAGSGIGASGAPILAEGVAGLACESATGGVFLDNTSSGDIAITTVGGTVGVNASTSGDIVIRNGAGSITLSQPVTGLASIALVAIDNITLGADVDASGGAGNVSIRADGNGTVAFPSDGAGAVIGGAGVIAMGTGDLVLTAGSGIGSAGTHVQTTGLSDFAAESDTGGVFVRNSGSGNLNVATLGGIVGVSAGAADVSLDNDGGAVTVSDPVTGGGVTLSAAGSLAFNNDVTASGALSAIATGPITDGAGANLTVGGTSLFRTLNNAGAAITLDNAASHSFGDLTVECLNGAGAANAAGTITIVENTAMTLASVRTAAGAGFTSSGSMSDTGALSLTIDGDASFATLVANDTINLNQLAVGGTIALSTLGASGGATIVNSQNVDLAASTVGGLLDATATIGGIADSGAVAAASAEFSTVVAGNFDIVLDQTTTTGSVSFNTFGIQGDVVYTRAGNIDLGASAVTGNLSVTANGGGITDSGTVTAGSAVFSTGVAGNFDIDLNQTATTGAVSFNTLGILGDVIYSRTGNINLGASAVTGNLSVTANAGGITDSGTVTALSAVFSTGVAGNFDIVLDQTTTTGAVSFNTLGIQGDATYTRTGNINLGASSVGGNLSLTANGGGSISDSGAGQVSGNASFTTTGGGNIDLDLLNVNGPASTIAVNTPGFATLVNTSAIRLAASTVGTVLTATANSGGIAISGASTVGGDLSLTALGGGSLSDTASIQAAGNATFTTVGGGNIALDQLDVDGPASTIAVTTPGSATIGNTTAVRLASASVGGLLGVTAGGGGSITDPGAAIIAGSAAFTANGGGDIDLDLLQVPGAIALNTTSGGTGNATILNTLGAGVATIIDDSNVFGALTINSPNGGMQFGNAALDVVEAASLGVVAAGDLTDVGRLSITGASNLNPGGSSVVLNNAASDFAGLVTVANATNVTVADANNLNVAAPTVPGALSLSAGLAGAGQLTQTGAFDVAGTATFAAGTGGIVLTEAANNFQNTVFLNTTGAAELQNSALATVIGDSAVAGLLTLDTPGGGVQFGAAGSDVVDLGSLALSANGSVTQFAGSAIVVDDGAGITLLGAGQSVILGETANNFDADGGGDGISVAGTGPNRPLDVTIRDQDALVLGDLDVEGALDVGAGGPITQTGGADRIRATGVASFDAGGGAVTLANAGNDFDTDGTGDGVHVANAGAVMLTDSNAITLGAVGASSLSVVAGAAIGQTATDNLTVSGLTTLDAGAGAGVVLLNASNNFGGVSIVDAASAFLRDTDALVLGPIDVAGQLNVTAGGPVTSNGALHSQLTIILTRNDAGASITLGDPASTFGGLVLASRNAANSATTSGNITVVEGSAMNLVSVETLGSGSFTASGPITDAGTLTIAGDATFRTRTGAGAEITLDSATSTFGRLTARSENATGTPGVLTSGNITIREGGPMALLDVATTGNVTLTAAGSILEAGVGADPGADVTAAIASLNATGPIGGAGGSALETAVANLVVATTGGPVIIDEADAINLQSIFAAGAVTIRTLGAGNMAIGLINAGAAGSVTLNAGAGSIVETAPGDAAADVIAGTFSATATGQIGGGAPGAIETEVQTLTAGAGGVISISHKGAVLSADLDSASGAVSIATNGVLSTGGAWSGASFLVTANDMNVNHQIASTGGVTIRRQSQGAIALGTGGQLNPAELALISANGLTIGGPNVTSMSVNGFSAPGVTGMTTLNATGPGGTVAFSGGASQFGALTVLADNGISVATDVSTTAGTLALNGDFDGVAQGVDSIAFTGNRTLTSAGSLTLSAEGGGVTAEGISLDATGPITVSDRFTGSGVVKMRSDGDLTILADTSAGDMALDADADGSGGGTLAVGSAATLSSTGLLSMSGADVDLDGFILNGNSDVAITHSAGGSIGVGSGAGTLGLSTAELGRIAARDVFIGDRVGVSAATPAIIVDGIGAGQVTGIAGTVTFGALAPGGTVTFSGGSTFLEAIAVNAAGPIAINAGVNTDGAMTLNNGGELTVGAGIAATGGFSQTGAGPVSLGASIAAPSGAVAFASPVTLTSDVTLTGAGITLGAGVDSDAPAARSLTLDTTGGGVTTLTGGLGLNQALNQITTNADGSTRLAADVAVMANTVNFGDSIAGDGVATRSLSVTTLTSHAVFAGGVDLTGAAGQAGGTLGVASAGDINVGGGISTRGGAAASPGNAGGNVTLDAPQGSIRVAGIDASGSDATASGAGGNAGVITLRPDTDLVSLTAVGGQYLGLGGGAQRRGLIEISGDLIADGGAGTGGGAAGLGGLISIAPDARQAGAGPAIPGVATVVGTGDVTISATGTGGVVEFGRNEKVVVLGDLSITAANEIRVQDVATQGDMTLTAPTIRIFTRAAANLLFPQGATVSGQVVEVSPDKGADFVAGGQIVLASPNVVLDPDLPTGPDAVPQLIFADGDGQRNGAPENRLYLLFSAADLDFLFDPAAAPQDRIVLDLNARGSSAQTVATALAGALPQFEAPEVTEATGLDTGQKDKIRQLGITPRDLSSDERVLVLLGRALYDDFPPFPVSTDPAGTVVLPVAASRLPSDQVSVVLERYDALFNKEIINPTTGQLERVDRTEEMRDTLTQSVRRYREQPGATGMDPGAFRAYLEQNPATEAASMEIVEGLESFLNEMGLLGLAPREESAAFNELLTPIRPRGMTTNELLQVVRGGPDVTVESRPEEPAG